MPARERSDKIQTTVRLPRTLYEQARWLIKRNVSSAASINDFVIAALTSYVKMLKRKQIDAAFAGMAEDADYQKEAQRIVEGFAESDWEALQIAEKDTAVD